MGKVDCIFCGEHRQRAKEHVWPAWLQAELGQAKVARTGTHATFAGRVVSQRTHAYSAGRLGHVCATCNNGWMSQLEVSARPVLRPLVLPSSPASRRLSSTDAATLARWAFKTAIVINAAENYRRIVPSEHFRHLERTGEIPPGVWVDMGFAGASNHLGWIQSQTLLGFADDPDAFRADAERSYKIVLGVGPLVLRVVHFPDERYDLVAGGPSGGEMLRLHPDALGAEVEDLRPFDDLQDFEMSCHLALGSTG